MIGFDSLSDYVFPKFWLKTLARFLFQFILYLSVLVFHKGGVGGGGGCYVMVSSTFFCQSWTEISLSRACLHTNKISNNSCSFKEKSKYYRFSFTLRQEWCWLMQKWKASGKWTKKLSLPESNIYVFLTFYISRCIVVIFLLRYWGYFFLIFLCQTLPGVNELQSRIQIRVMVDTK